MIHKILYFKKWNVYFTTLSENQLDVKIMNFPSMHIKALRYLFLMEIMFKRRQKLTN